jgi:gliding motility-associated-like protein
VWIDITDFDCNNIGENSVTLTVVDLSGNTSTCESTVTVEQGNANCFDTPPVAVNDTFYLIAGCDYTPIVVGNVLDNDFDAQGDSLFTTLLQEPNSGQLNFSADGSFTFNNDNEFVGTVTYTYKACEVNNTDMCDEASVTIIVQTDQDCDGIVDNIDIDDDNDGMVDTDEGMIDNDFDGNPDAGTVSLDSDSDGIPDYLDIDSDNDGITDNEEWQIEGQYIALSCNDSNGDGWDDAYDVATGGTYYEAIDTDGDGTPDYLDLDTDADGIDDYIEGNDANADAIADFLPYNSDSDIDGLDDAYDTVNGWLDCGNPMGSNAPLQDTPDLNGVQDGIRDWRDSDPIPGDTTTTQECELFIPNGFSPNDDGINDYFVIDCIQNFPNAKIEIYNRWGNLVFEKENYGNIERWGSISAWWGGYSSNGWTVGKDKLPSGTYFYILNFNDGTKEPVAGSIFLNR